MRWDGGGVSHPSVMTLWPYIIHRKEEEEGEEGEEECELQPLSC